MELKKRITTGLALGALIASSLLPGVAFADTSVTISGNGVASSNHVNVTNSTKKTVTQTNVVFVGTLVVNKSNTGGNKASGNTGGNNTITTGNATSNSSVNVTAGGNVLNQTSDCGCNSSNTTVSITNNGVLSHNGVNVTNKNTNKTNQTSVTTVLTGVFQSANTGGNKEKNNTGGDNSITTGEANSTSTVEVTSSVNVINP